MTQALWSATAANYTAGSAVNTTNLYGPAAACFTFNLFQVDWRRGGVEGDWGGGRPRAHCNPLLEVGKGSEEVYVCAGQGVSRGLPLPGGGQGKRGGRGGGDWAGGR